MFIEPEQDCVKQLNGKIEFLSFEIEVPLSGKATLGIMESWRVRVHCHASCLIVSRSATSKSTF